MNFLGIMAIFIHSPLFSEAQKQVDSWNKSRFVARRSQFPCYLMTDESDKMSNSQVLNLNLVAFNWNLAWGPKSNERKTPSLGRKNKTKPVRMTIKPLDCRVFSSIKNNPYFYICISLSNNFWPSNNGVNAVLLQNLLDYSSKCALQSHLDCLS